MSLRKASDLCDIEQLLYSHSVLWCSLYFLAIPQGRWSQCRQVGAVARALGECKGMPNIGAPFCVGGQPTQVGPNAMCALGCSGACASLVFCVYFEEKFSSKHTHTEAQSCTHIAVQVRRSPPPAIVVELVCLCSPQNQLHLDSKGSRSRFAPVSQDDSTKCWPTGGSNASGTIR